MRRVLPPDSVRRHGGAQPTGPRPRVRTALGVTAPDVTGYSPGSRPLGGLQDMHHQVPGPVTRAGGVRGMSLPRSSSSTCRAHAPQPRPGHDAVTGTPTLAWITWGQRRHLRGRHPVLAAAAGPTGQRGPFLSNQESAPREGLCTETPGRACTGRPLHGGRETTTLLGQVPTQLRGQRRGPPLPGSTTVVACGAAGVPWAVGMCIV